MTHQFNPRHMDRLVGPDRRKMLDPARILGYLHLKPGMVLADVGAGPGFFSLEAAKMVAPTGKVLAIDVSQDMLDACRQRAREAGLNNVETVLAKAPHDYPLAAAVADAALMAVVLHEAESPAKMVGEVRRILKPGGAVVVVEWKREGTPTGPPLSSRLDQRQVTEVFTGGGFLLTGAFEVGPHHYGLEFTLPAR